MRIYLDFFCLDFDHYTCQCNNGFFGDGLDCEYFGVNVIEGDCERDSQCNINEKCVINFKQGALTYSCIEKNGGSHIEVTTEKIRKPDLCLDNSECAENAECSYDSVELRYECQCKKNLVMAQWARKFKKSRPKNHEIN